MKIDRVSYQKTFSIGPYLNDKVGIEAQVEPSETPELVLTTLKTIVEQWHQNSNRSLYQHDLVISKEESEKSVAVVDSELDNLRKLLRDIDYQEDALALIKKAGFQYHVELNAIVKSKPNKK